MRNNNVLVVAAHPDDEVLGCGGTISKLSAEGWDVNVLILGQGIVSRYDSDEQGVKSKTESNISGHIEAASKILGVKKVFAFDLPDNSFDKNPLLETVRLVEKIKKQTNPSIVFTHFAEDLNIDHRITFNAVMTSFRPLPGETLASIYSFEVLSSTEYSHFPFKPNCYFDISKHIQNKISAMNCYVTEVRDWPHPRSERSIKVLAEKRGSEIGIENAEAFVLIRGVMQ